MCADMPLSQAREYPSVAIGILHQRSEQAGVIGRITLKKVSAKLDTWCYTHGLSPTREAEAQG